MNEYDDFDELDRALFALPLEEAPAGLHASILNATIYAPKAALLPFAVWEIAAIGTALAIAVWLVLLSVADHAFASALTANAKAILQAFGNPAILSWCAAGSCVAVVVSLASGTPLRLPDRKRG